MTTTMTLTASAPLSPRRLVAGGLAGWLLAAAAACTLGGTAAHAAEALPRTAAAGPTPTASSTGTSSPARAPAQAAGASAAALHSFDAQRWAALLREPGPALVVFTSTDCAYCPDAIERLSLHLRSERQAGRAAPRLDVVVMDGADQPEAVLADPHYQTADRLFVFDGQAARLRRSVNPGWFGQTPYIALLPSARSGEAAVPRFVAGTPTTADLNALR
jgi:hypothetical protein